MYQEAHAFVADLLKTLNELSARYADNDFTPYVSKVVVQYPNDDKPLGHCADEIGGQYVFVPYKEGGDNDD